jgi:ACS family sodium-dependent inorganic phosphate cotransporter-like MFS transporter 9
MPAASLDLHWSKTEVGTVLSSFFWGYALTQILGGYLSDRFGAERVLLAAGLGWGLVTVRTKFIHLFPEELTLIFLFV